MLNAPSDHPLYDNVQMMHSMVHPDSSSDALMDQVPGSVAETQSAATLDAEPQPPAPSIFCFG